jgi:hemoglobin
VPVEGSVPEAARGQRAIWAEALGGPAEYSGSLGDHSQVPRLPSGNGERAEIDERAQG